MEYRSLGNSDLKVPPLTLGTAMFGSKDMPPEFSRRMVDICLDVGLNMFDTAAADTQGTSELTLGEVIQGKRSRVIISCTGPKEPTGARQNIIQSVEDSLSRLQTDYIDLYQFHGFDSQTPIEETLGALNQLVQAGKIRQIGCSNFNGWQLMKSLAVSTQHSLARFVSHQAYYSLIDRAYEWELMPLGLAEQVSCIGWSPLGWGRIATKNQPRPKGDEGPVITQDLLYRIIDVLEMVSKNTGRTTTQISLNWLLSRPGVATLIVGARNEEQLREKLGAVDWALSEEHLRRLNDASATPKPYPFWHPAGFTPGGGSMSTV